MRPAWAVLVGLVALAGAVSAADAASICVELDTDTNRLALGMRGNARLMFENALRAGGSEVTGTCDESRTVTLVTPGGGAQVRVVTPTGAMTASTTLDQLATAFGGVVWRGLAMRTRVPAPATRPPVLQPEAPPPVEAQPRGTPAAAAPTKPNAGAIYVRIGYAVAPVPKDSPLEPHFGPTIGVGYRRIVDAWLFDLSVLNTHVWRSKYYEGIPLKANVLSFGRIAVYRLLPFDAGSSFYIGGALSVGESAVQRSAGYQYSVIETHAIQVEGTAGYEFLQNRSTRLFVEANVVAPLAKVDVPVYGPTGPLPGESYWAPTLQLSAGVGF